MNKVWSSYRTKGADDSQHLLAALTQLRGTWAAINPGFPTSYPPHPATHTLEEVHQAWIIRLYRGLEKHLLDEARGAGGESWAPPAYPGSPHLPRLTLANRLPGLPLPGRDKQVSEDTTESLETLVDALLQNPQ